MVDEKKNSVFWEVWYPKAASTGLLLARGELGPTDRLLLHAVPRLDGALDAWRTRGAAIPNRSKTRTVTRCLPPPDVPRGGRAYAHRPAARASVPAPLGFCRPGASAG